MMDFINEAGYRIFFAFIMVFSALIALVAPKYVFRCVVRAGRECDYPPSWDFLCTECGAPGQYFDKGVVDVRT